MNTFGLIYRKKNSNSVCEDGFKAGSKMGFLHGSMLRRQNYEGATQVHMGHIGQRGSAVKWLWIIVRVVKKCKGELP